MVVSMPPITVVCDASTTEKYRTLTRPVNALQAASLLQAVIRIDSMDANFRCRLGVRRALDPSGFGAIATPTSQDGSSYVSAAGTAGEKLWRFDPNGASGGDIDNNAALFQVVLLYSTSAGTAMGTVTIENLSWR